MTSAADNESICVGVRLRPFVAYENGQKQCLTIKDNVVSIVAEVAGRESKDFGFDEAMDSMDPSSPSYVSQGRCYELMAHRMVSHVFQGYNTCLFCYGQTGTGKTTTIMGKTSPVSEQGLLLRLLTDVFIEVEKNQRQGSEVHLKVQMLEVYNEKIKDLLLPHGSTQGKPPDVHVHPKCGVYLKGVTEEAVESASHCVRLIDYGNTMKTVAATAMNAKSSRAHTVFRLSMEKTGGNDNLAVMSEVFFVDLAGRENEKSTKVVGERLVELTFINRSLMWLAHCIQSLGNESSPKRKTIVSGRKSVAPPGAFGGDSGRKSLAPRKSMAPVDPDKKDMSKFRNSKLTLLLSNALSGNSKTAMIGTLSPAVANFEESYSTLNFAATVKNIKVDAVPASAVDKDSLVESLQEELRQLKQQLARSQQDDTDVTDNDEIVQKFESTQALCSSYEKNWDEMQEESVALMAQREQAMHKLGIARWNLAATKAKMSKHKSPSEMKNPLPYLSNYSDDPYLSGRFVLYPSEVGKEYCIGFGEGADFVVPHGLGVCAKTCYLRRDFGRLFIRIAERRQIETWPSGSKGSGVGLAEVNGVRVGVDWVELQHQDCVVLGRSQMYYAFTKEDGGVQALPTSKQGSFPEGNAGSDSSEALINTILGPGRAADMEQLHLARKYYSQLQSQNLDAEGATSLHNFLLQARRAMKMVEEANDITAAVKPKSGLNFELTATAPVLAFGFGSSSFPEFCVRLVRRVPEARASRKLTIEKLRRQSVHADMEMLQKFAMDGLSQTIEPDEAKVEVIHTWHFSKFTARLQLMQDAHESWTQDPDNFSLGAFNDPWSEYGLGEIEQLQQQFRDEKRKLRESFRDSHIVHKVLTGSGSEQMINGEQLTPRTLAAAAHSELQSLRESHRHLEKANARLKNDLRKAQAEAKKLFERLAAKSNSKELEALSTEMQSIRSDRDLQDPKLKSRAAGDGQTSCSSRTRTCLEVSKVNLSLVEDLFQLSIALLRAGTAALQAQASNPADASSIPAATRDEQGRLADAASELVTFLTKSGPLGAWEGKSVAAAAATAAQLSAFTPMVHRSESFPSTATTSFTPRGPSAEAFAPWYMHGVAGHSLGAYRSEVNGVQSSPLRSTTPLVRAPVLGGFSGSQPGSARVLSAGPSRTRRDGAPHVVPAPAVVASQNAALPAVMQVALTPRSMYVG